MKLLQKILFVIIIGVFTNNADGMTVVNGIITVLPAVPLPHVPFAPPAPGVAEAGF